MCTEIKYAKRWSVLPIILVTVNFMTSPSEMRTKMLFFQANLIKQKISLDMVGLLRQSFNTICLDEHKV